MRLPWFKLNKRKIGWVPVSAMGWLITFGFLAFTAYNFMNIYNNTQSLSDTLINFMPQTIIFTGLFSVICFFSSAKA